MKKTVWLALILLLVCVFAFSACDSGDTSQTPNDTPSGTTYNTTESETDAHVHAFGEWTTIKDATCTVKGEQERSCSCGEKETQSIDATGHSKELDDYVAPTCQQTGLTQGSHCKICSTILEEQTEIPIINHIFDTYICTMCKAKQEPIVTFDVSQNQDFSIVLNIYYYENRADLYEIELCGSGKMKDFPFLVEYPDSPYTSILPYVRKLTIADDVTYIGDNAFYKIGNIGTLTIPDSVVGIGDFAFAHSDITSIILPASIKTLGERVFYNSRSLYNISIPDNLPGSCNDMIIQCPNLRYTKYKNGLYIGNEDNPYVMLCGTVNQIQKDFQIHSSTKIIAYEAFANYSVLESVSIPDSVTCIGDFAFSRCTSLKAISIPENTTYLGEASFYDCANLEEVSYFAKSCSNAGSPGYPLFYRCTQFTKLIIGESVQSIPENTFNSCYNLVDIYNLSSLVIDLGSETHGMAGYYAFYIYSSLDEERKTILTDEEYLFAEKNSVWYLVAYLGTKTELVFPTNINGQNYYVNSNAFTYSKITKVTIVGGVDKILSYAFDTCQNLTDVYILSDLIVVDKQAFVRGNLRNLVLPNTVQNIGNSDWVSFTLYYYGTKDEWNFVENLQKNMSVYYYSENAPTDLSYQYWHFVDGVPAVW